jgi:Zn2+/Cd2+-exporting ATPase
VTGESLPVLKQRHSLVFSGGQVLDGALVVRTSAGAADSTAARIASVTSAALEQRAPVETALHRLTKRWSQAVLAVTAIAFGGLLIAGVPMWGSRGAVYRALGLLTATAPCALLLVPLAFVCAVAVLSRHGIIVKGAHLFDQLQRVTFVALDKTGTLSEGQLTCSAIRGVWGGNSAGIDPLQAAAALSFRGRHPVCSAVLKELAKQQSSTRQSRTLQSLRRGRAPGNVPDVSRFSAQAGAGMSGLVAHVAVSFGSVAHVTPLLSEQQRQALEVAVQRSGSNAVHSVLVQGPLTESTNNGAAPPGAERITLFVFSDQPKGDSKGVIAQLRSMGLRVGLYTGDNISSAHAMAVRIGVTDGEVQAELSPERKAELVEGLQQRGEHVLMVGDGINDAPALVRADVSMALADNMESATAGVADVVLLHGSASTAGGQPASVLRIAFLLRVARQVRAIVAQNLVITFCSMIAAAGPALGGIVPLWVAVLVHEGSTVLVALNSCRLLLLRQPQLQAQAKS